MPEQTKSCPHCGGTILAAATRCKHCKTDVAAPGQSVAMPAASTAKRGRPIVWIVVAVLVAATFGAGLYMTFTPKGVGGRCDLSKKRHKDCRKGLRCTLANAEMLNRVQRRDLASQLRRGQYHMVCLPLNEWLSIGCRKQETCAAKGECSPAPDLRNANRVLCVATLNADCMRSRVCKEEGKCLARNRRCVKE